MSIEKKKYDKIFGSSILFGFVQLINIMSRAIQAKVISFYFGVNGIAFLSIIQSVYDLTKAFFLCGINESSVREISKYVNFENERNNVIKRILSLTMFLSIVGFFTIFFSAKLISSYLNISELNINIISFSVFFFILSEGRLSILRSLRLQKKLAMARIVSSIISLIFGTLSILFFNYDGIVTSLLIYSLSSYFLSLYYTYDITKNITFELNLLKVFQESTETFKLGFSLMLLGFLALLADFTIKMYLNTYGSNVDLGYFQAGNTIISGYLGLVIVSIVSDYFPRITSLVGNQNAVSLELNKQALIVVYMLIPLIIILVLFADLIITLLYSKEFVNAKIFVCVAISGSFLNVFSNLLGYILISNNDSKLFLLISICLKLFHVLSSILFYEFFNLLGLALSFLILSVINFFTFVYFLRNKYGICFEKSIYNLIIIGKSIIILISILSYNIGYNLHIFVLFPIVVFVFCIYKLILITGFYKRIVK